MGVRGILLGACPATLGCQLEKGSERGSEFLNHLSRPLGPRVDILQQLGDSGERCGDGRWHRSPTVSSLCRTSAEAPLLSSRGSTDVAPTVLETPLARPSLPLRPHPVLAECPHRQHLLFSGLIFLQGQHECNPHLSSLVDDDFQSDK